MEKHLWILRHATAAHADGFGDDFSRPLTPTGRQEASNVGGWLKAQGVHFDLLIVSPAVRTKETAQIVADEFGDENLLSVYDESIYEAEKNTLIKLVATLSSKHNRVLLVGHNPGVEALVGGCARDVQCNMARFSPASIAHVVFPDDWSDALVGLGDFITIRHAR